MAFNLIWPRDQTDRLRQTYDQVLRVGRTPPLNSPAIACQTLSRTDSHCAISSFAGR